MGLAEQPRSLRERKKIRTREAIRRAAMQLIEINGYANTTVEQIAEAAEVSPATFFRYFPTKGSALITNDLDQVFISALAGQPTGVPTAEAFRRALEITVTALYDDDEWESERSRRHLVFSIPELKALQFAEHRRTGAAMAAVECRRLGREPDDFEVQVFFGAIVDAGLAVLDKAPDAPDRLFRVVKFIDDGMPLH
jgi:AcrR family transcriptional regulator